jgi:hypothetical protein
MNLTPDTKLSEIIPEGTEYAGYSFAHGEIINTHNAIIIFYKEKERSLENYAVGYADSMNYTLSETKRFQDKIKNKDFDAILLSDKIGLLKYVCNCFKQSWIDILYCLQARSEINAGLSGSRYKQIYDILPQKFIESILKE